MSDEQLPQTWLTVCLSDETKHHAQQSLARLSAAFDAFLGVSRPLLVRINGGMIAVVALEHMLKTHRSAQNRA